MLFIIKDAMLFEMGNGNRIIHTHNIITCVGEIRLVILSKLQTENNYKIVYLYWYYHSLWRLYVCQSTLRNIMIFQCIYIKLTVKMTLHAIERVRKESNCNKNNKWYENWYPSSTVVEKVFTYACHSGEDARRCCKRRSFSIFKTMRVNLKSLTDKNDILYH